MKDEKIIQYLKDANLWGENNLYFFAVAPVSFSSQENIYGLNVLNIKYYIINRNENGIAIIPFDETLKSIKQLITMIPHSNIKKVYTEKYKFMFFMTGGRLVIKTNDDKVVELDYPTKENEKFLSSNMYKFVTEYKNKVKEKVIMNINFILKEEISINNELCCKIEITNDKKNQENIRESYCNKMVEAIKTGKTKIYFYAETIPDDKKTIKISTETFSEFLFDAYWYLEDSDIEGNNFEVVIIVEDERTQNIYRTACKKMGLI